jgi:beta-aspartyl-peptidase (threonine type)
MDGSTMQFGGVIGIEGNQNPIHLARQVLQTPHNVFFGNFQEFDTNKNLEVHYRIEELREWKLNNGQDDTQWGGTVGVVVFDGRHIAAGTSTGGMTGKPKNRVGDSPIPGAGTFANRWGGASATGEGAPIMIQGLTRRAIDIMRDGDLSPQRASRNAILKLASQYQGVGGIILADTKGRIGAFTNASHMAYSYMKARMSIPEVVVKNKQ